MKLRNLEELRKDLIYADPKPYDEWIKVAHVHGIPLLELFASKKEVRNNGKIDPRKQDDAAYLIWKFWVDGFDKVFARLFTPISKQKWERIGNRSADKFGKIWDSSRIADAGLIKHNRIGKNLFCDNIYNTKKANSIETRTVLEALNGVLVGDLSKVMVSPSTFKSYRISDYEQIPLWLNNQFCKASIFAPEGYLGIVEQILKAKNILIPAGSWASPAVVHASSQNIERMTVIDVIPKVLEDSEYIFNKLQETDLFNDGTKIFDTICCPSQHILSRHPDLIKKGSYDTVFFSPPYYDVELYEGGEQSWKEYSTYQEWLDGYWRGTLELCVHALKSGGKFAFAIMNYKDKTAKFVNISEDMRDIASEYFDFVETAGIRHGQLNRFSDELPQTSKLDFDNGCSYIETKEQDLNKGRILDKLKNGFLEDLHIFSVR